MPFALPERDRPGHTGRRRDEDAVARDLLDAPRRRAEQERLAGPRLVDHLLVELADTAAAVDEIHAEKTAIRNRPRIGHRQPAGTAAASDDAGGAIPDDARSELGELVGRIAAREHVEHVLELRPREIREWVRATHELVQVVDRDLLVCCDRDDLLREDVEWVARDDGLFDLAFEHALHHHRRLEQIRAVFREDASLRHGVQLVPGATDTLQAARNGLRRLDLDDEVDRSHVDAELERRRGDETRDLPRLQQLLDLDALLACD